MNSKEKTKLSFLKKNNSIMKVKYGIDCSTQYDLDSNGSLLAFNKYKKLMTCRYEVIGTFNNKSCTWRWAWSNESIPCNLRQLSLKTIKYGEDTKNEEFINSKIKGKKNMIKYVTIASMYDSSITGYLAYKKPNSGITIYIVLKNCKIPSKKSKGKKHKKTRKQSCQNIHNKDKIIKLLKETK